MTEIKNSEVEEGRVINSCEQDQLCFHNYLMGKGLNKAEREMLKSGDDQEEKLGQVWEVASLACTEHLLSSQHHKQQQLL